MKDRYQSELCGGGAVLVKQYLVRGGNYQFCWHRSMELMLILKGAAEVFADGNQHLLEKGDLLLINANCGHSIFLRDLDTVLMVAEIAPEFFQYAFQNEMSEPCIDCVSTDQNRNAPLFIQLRFLMMKAFSLSLSGSEFKEQLALQYMAVLTSELMLNFPTRVLGKRSSRAGKEKAALQKAMQYIESNYEEKITLEQVAAHVQYNRTYLSTLFKQNVGILFNDYISRVRLRHALEALSDMDRSIVSIALGYGFPDSKSFSSSIKKYCGHTPQEYRQALQKNPSLKVLSGEDKCLPRPDPEIERLMRQFLLELQPGAGGGNPREWLDCCDQIQALAEKMKGFA